MRLTEKEKEIIWNLLVHESEYFESAQKTGDKEDKKLYKKEQKQIDKIISKFQKEFIKESSKKKAESGKP